VGLGPKYAVRHTVGLAILESRGGARGRVIKDRKSSFVRRKHEPFEAAPAIDTLEFTSDP